MLIFGLKKLPEPEIDSHRSIIWKGLVGAGSMSFMQLHTWYNKFETLIMKVIGGGGINLKLATKVTFKTIEQTTNKDQAIYNLYVAHGFG